MKLKLLLIPFIFILSLITVNAQIIKEPILGETFNLNDASTSSATFINVDSQLINVTRETRGFIRLSFQGTKNSGTADITDFFWRILFDGEEITNTTHALEVLETVPIQMQESVAIVSVGVHNITLQHRVEVNSMTTEAISVSFVTNQFLNGTTSQAVNDTLNFTVDDVEVFTLMDTFTFTKQFADSSIFVSLFGRLFSETSSNFDVEIKAVINGEESGVFGSGIESPDDNKHISYTWIYSNVVQGVNTVDIFARNVQNTKTAMFNGDIDIIELQQDGIRANVADIEIGTFSTSSFDPILVDSLLINVSNDATLLVIVETTATKSGAGKDNFTMFIDTNSSFKGMNHTMELESASDVANFAFIEIPKFSPAVAEEINLTLFAVVNSATTVTFTNISFIAVELLPLEFLIINEPPTSTLINPPDNNITNETTITFEANVTDSLSVITANLFHNATGTFILNETQSVNSAQSIVFFNVTFPTNITIIWNVEAIDNNLNVFAVSNRTLTINQSFLLDSDPPVITLIRPSNNTVNNIIPLPINFTVTDNSSNDIICQLSNSTTIFDEGTFIQGAESILFLGLGEIALSQTFPSLDITCFDNTPLNNSAILNLNYTLDTPPVIFLNLPGNRSRFNKEVTTEINIRANCTDAPIFRFNITITNASDTIASFEDRTSVDNFLFIDDILSITDLGLGNYTVTHLCSDPHTKESIPDYTIQKTKSENKLEWRTGENTFAIKYDDSNVVGIDSFSTTKSAEDDRYTFNFKINESDRSKSTFIFVIENTESIYYIADSSYKAHFITGNNWIDFELPDDPDATYSVVLNGDNYYEISIITTLRDLKFNSIGELNINIIETQFEIFSIEQITDFFDVRVCRTDTGSVLLLALFLLVAFILIGMGLATQIGFIGVFGALTLLFSSLFIVPCARAIATILIFVSLLFFIFFVIRGFFPRMTDIRR